MKKILYRGKNKEIVSLNKLYEQSSLRENLDLPSDLREHYLSLIYRIPTYESQLLIRNAVDWTQGWQSHNYFIQRIDTLHLTLVDLGEINSIEIDFSVEELVRRIENVLNEFLQNGKLPSTLILSRPEISSSGINCSIAADKNVKELVEALYQRLDFKESKKLEKRSLSIFRYLISNLSGKKKIQKYLYEIGTEEEEKCVEYNRAIEINRDGFCLVRLDKVADYFQILHSF